MRKVLTVIALLTVALVAMIMLTGAAAPSASPIYPAWLEMQPGWAEECARAGRCIPMTDEDLQEYARVIAGQVMQMCRANRI